MVEKAPEVSAEFTIEEMAAMEQLADMGRLFDDEDEARMVKLVEDLTAWINKYAPTFEDPEEVLFEVTAPLVSDELAAEYNKPIEQQPQATSQSISITFSFGETNEDWFVFEQTVAAPEDEQAVFVSYEFNMNDIWGELTKDIKDKDDWANLHDDQWDQLINIQYMEDEEIDSIVDNWLKEQEAIFQAFEQDTMLSFEPQQVSFAELQGKSADEIKLALDSMSDYKNVVDVMK